MLKKTNCLSLTLGAMAIVIQQYPGTRVLLIKYLDDLDSSIKGINTIVFLSILYRALDRGMEWGMGILIVIQANQNHLKDYDSVTKLQLHALAAKELGCDLKTIHYLLQKNPD